MQGPIGLDDAFARFEERWSPRIVAEVNDYDVKIARVEGEFARHVHDETDEFFHVLAGELTLHLESDQAVVLRAGDVFTVPRGMSHQPVAAPGTRILMFEPQGTRNTGDESGTPGAPLDR